MKIEYIDITEEEFNKKIADYENNLKSFFEESRKLETDILDSLNKIQFQKVKDK